MDFLLVELAPYGPLRSALHPLVGAIDQNDNSWQDG